MERAREKGHKPELIAGLAHDEHMRFLEAGMCTELRVTEHAQLTASTAESLSTVDFKLTGKFLKYLQFKAKFYEAYVRTQLYNRRLTCTSRCASLACICSH